MSLVPVVQGGMQWVGYAELASAVSNAGGLGIVGIQISFDTDQSNIVSSQPSHNPPPKTFARKFEDAAA